MSSVRLGHYLDTIMPFDLGPINVQFGRSPVELARDVRLDGKFLYWKPAVQTRVPGGSVLDVFRRLHAQPDAMIAKFVERFGPAYFCDHHCPWSHANDLLFGKQFGMVSCGPQKDAGFFVEHLADYRSFSAAADALIEATGFLNANEMPSQDLLDRFIYFSGTRLLAERPTKAIAIRIARGAICREVTAWLEMAHIGPSLSFDERAKVWRRHIGHSTYGVLGAVALALMTGIPQTGGWLLCSICGHVFRASRPAAPGRNVYCHDCRNSPKMWTLLKRQQRNNPRRKTFSKPKQKGR